ncbi:GNAT family N-acetyltransferase [Paenibacillus sp. 5J-6]|uniref:GNAT family N-acetyltransferase n=1 Tax=Paenibacillus silvestris TaxID=2606219 RepID=A0A6L8V7N0_9BACL|nr:GNAT family N-acetyltransferase [Paenibacillus silvestris]MZQ85339.1 GNAT family N-acetyltransferase [Paenibacillus silvestris]
MNNEELYLEIKEAQESQLDFLVTQFSPDNPKFQYNRFAVQKRGEGLYMIAWHNNAPVGHFLLRWSGPHVESVTKLVDISHSAFLEAGLTIDEYRRKGVATAIIKEAERLAKERKCTSIGLEVGISNAEAKRLYQKLGYIDWGHGEFLISWEYEDEYGNTGIETEVVIYMQKELILAIK